MTAVPYMFECDLASGFLPAPNEHKSVGYVTALDGFGLGSPLHADLTVSVPHNGPSPKFSGINFAAPPGSAKSPQVATVVGVIEKFSWPGGVGDAINIEFWCSQENATQIKAIQQLALKNTIIKSLSWWIADYDQETKVWHEAAYPQSPTSISGRITGKENPELNIDLTPFPVRDGIDINVYKISISVQPAANQQYSLHFANSSAKPVVKSWGLVVGHLADPLKPAAPI
jgi:hypothetical protein